MTTQPASETTLEGNGHAVTLRASLRAGVAIENMPGGFPEVWDQISRLSYTAIRGVILAAVTDRQEAQRFLSATASKPLASFLSDAQAACLAVLASYFTEPAEAAQSRATTAEAMPLRIYFQSLYDYATGWLGWPPADTWAASPAEIETAFAAHVDRLVKLTPGLSSKDGDQSKGGTVTAYSAEQLREIDEQGYDPAFDRGAFAAFKARYSE